jgi:UDPglucose--hexose-1-phosphate uridylyltransferase
MSTLRQDLATRTWSIIAKERGKRPDDFAKPKSGAGSKPAHDEKCPFCTGNEDKTPEAVFTIPASGGGDAKDWAVRVVPNKFAALSPPEPETDTGRTRTGLYFEMAGCGAHEVVIEVPDHSRTIATMSEEEVSRVIHTYRERFLELDRDEWNQLIIIFRNQGEEAGTSLEHPHSQIIGTPVVPQEIRRRLEEALRYYDDNGTCVYCDILHHELAEKTRLVGSNAGFVALCPFASTVPYEIWILPRRHASSFGVLTEEGAGLLAKLLRETLQRLHHLLDNPDYNYVVRSAPHHSAGEPHFHWYIEILPRLTTRAGFEIGSGMNINIVAPEDAAAQLREAL